MTTCFVDGHVHLQSVYDLDRFLDRAAHVSKRASAPVFLWFVENWGDRAFAALRDGTWVPSRHRVVATSEVESLRVESAEGEGVFLVSGRQVVTTENLEVLIVGLSPDDELAGVAPRAAAADVLLRRGLAKDALVGLPWGFGKWLGPRGRTVDEVAARPEFRNEPRFFFGDILARCRPWPEPSVFRSGPPVLPGTDPLPLVGFEDRVLRYGFRVEAVLDPDRPWRSLRSAVLARAGLEPFGGPDGLVATIVNQTRYRLRKRSAS